MTAIISFFLSPLVLGTLFVLALVLEANHRNYLSALVSTALLTFSYHYLQAVHPIEITLGYVLGAICVWFVVGLVFSVWRWKRFCDSQVAKVKRGDFMSVSLNPNSNIDRITLWVVFWPMSILANLLDDVISIVQRLILTLFLNVYAKIGSNAANSIKEIEYARRSETQKRLGGLNNETV